MAEQIKKFHFGSTKRTKLTNLHSLSQIVEKVEQIAKVESKNRNIDIDAGYFIGLCQYSFGLAIALWPIDHKLTTLYISTLRIKLIVYKCNGHNCERKRRQAKIVAIYFILISVTQKFYVYRSTVTVRMKTLFLCGQMKAKQTATAPAQTESVRAFLSFSR